MDNEKQVLLRCGHEEITTAAVLYDDGSVLACEVRNAAGAVLPVSLALGVGEQVSPELIEVSQQIAEAIRKFLEDDEAAFRRSMVSPALSSAWHTALVIATTASPQGPDNRAFRERDG